MKYEITELDRGVEQLSSDNRELFHRLYSIDISTGSLRIPVEMEDWVKKRFGSLERVENQQIVTIKNRFTGEHSLFNRLRSDRPVEAKSAIAVAHEELEDKGRCLFCNSEKQTPADVFDRLKGEILYHGEQYSKV